MYWNTNSVSSSHLETLLSKEDVTLQELMDEEEVLQECKSQNKKLIDYLMRADVLEELVTLITVEPSRDCDEDTKYLYPNIACELLTCEVSLLNQRLANDEALLGKLFSFLEGEPPLNSLQASFFSKTFSVLIARTSEQNWYSYQLTCLQVLEFLKSKENCVSLLLKHLGTSAIMDLLFKLITKVEGVDMKQNILNWLDDQQLVQKVVALLDPSVESDVHYNAAQLLCDVIRAAREHRRQVTERTEQDRILDRIESPENISQLLDHILKEPKCETSIVGGISVLLTLLEFEKLDGTEGMLARFLTGDDTPDNEPPKVFFSTIQTILPRLKDFHDILINPPVKPAVTTTIGVLDPPLGNTRVEVTKLLSVLVSNNNADINKELTALGTINVLLDLFFKYTWNNFLHTQVEQCLAFVLNTEIPAVEGNPSEEDCLVAHILVKCRLLSRILEAWEENEVQQTTQNSPRRGYMGHLISISNNIVQQAEKGPLGAFLKETVDNETLVKWENFVATTLAEINKTYKKSLGGVNVQSNNSDTNSECKDFLDNVLENSLQELYTNYYHLQALAPSFTEHFGSFHEEQFNDNEDPISTSADPALEKLSFLVNEEDIDEREVLFQEVCAQKFLTLDEDDGYMWNKENVFSMDDNPHWMGDRKGATADKSSSDEEDNDNEDNEIPSELPPAERSGPDGSEDVHFELSSFGPEVNKVVPPVEDSNPWEGSTFGSSNTNAVTSPDQGWANFESAPFVTDFSHNLAPDINTTIASSGSCEIGTLSLDLTPSDNVNVEELFSKESEATQPSPLSDDAVDELTESMGAVNLDLDKDEKKVEAVVGEAEKVSETNTEVQTNSVQNPESSEESSSVISSSDQKELINNFKFLSTQGLISKCEQSSENEIEPQPQPQTPNESEEGYQLIKENVQVVPNQTTQTR